MSNEFLDWAGIETEFDDLDEVATVLNDYTDTNTSKQHQAPLKARQIVRDILGTKTPRGTTLRCIERYETKGHQSPK